MEGSTHPTPDWAETGEVPGKRCWAAKAPPPLALTAQERVLSAVAECSCVLGVAAHAGSATALGALATWSAVSNLTPRTGELTAARFIIILIFIQKQWVCGVGVWYRDIEVRGIIREPEIPSIHSPLPNASLFDGSSQRCGVRRCSDFEPARVISGRRARCGER